VSRAALSRSLDPQLASELSSLRLVIAGHGRWGSVHSRRWEALLGRPPALIIDPITPQGAHDRWRASVRACAEAELIGAVAVVATPIDQLTAVAHELIERGVRGLLIEKPGGCSARALEALERRAQERGVKIAVGYIERFNPALPPLLSALEAWLEAPSAHRAPLSVGRSARHPSITSAGERLDLWCHDLNIMISAIHRHARHHSGKPGARGSVESLGVTERGELMFEGQRVGELRIPTATAERGWMIGEQRYSLQAEPALDPAELDPLSLECLAFARWVTLGVWSSSLCALDEAIETLKALTGD